jgi:BON domain
MKTDSQLQQDVMDELQWEPRVEHANIGVAAKDGVVTLSGFVPSYTSKIAAEKAARRVKGVRGLAEEIEVRFASDPKTSDPEIAKRIADNPKEQGSGEGRTWLGDAKRCRGISFPPPSRQGSRFAYQRRQRRHQPD